MAYTGLVEKYDYVRQTRNANITAKLTYDPKAQLDYNDRSTQVPNTNYVMEHVDELNSSINYHDAQVLHKTGEMEEYVNGIKYFVNDVNFGGLSGDDQGQTFIPKVEIKNSETTFHHNVRLPTNEGTFYGNLIGNAQTANWADLAEVYETDKEYPVGTLVQFGGDKELTSATMDANFVISDKPGVLLNGGGKGQAVALIGRVPVRVLGKVRKFDKLGLSRVFDGRATASEDDFIKTSMKIVALESSDEVDEKLINCFVMVGV